MEYILRQHLAVGAEERVEPQAVGVVLSTEIALELQLADPEAEAVLEQQLARPGAEAVLEQQLARPGAEAVSERQLARPGAAAAVQAASAALAQKQVVLAVVMQLVGWARQAQRQAALVQ